MARVAGGVHRHDLVRLPPQRRRLHLPLSGALEHVRRSGDGLSGTHLRREILHDADIAARAGELRRTITEGIENHAKTTNRNGETIYAFETDGLGHVNIMDDSNVPSLMAAPLLGVLRTG